jgi:high-affinity Fe2+/Pb2+ permease
LGEILIAAEIMFLLWTINIILIVSGLVEIVAVLQVLRGKLNSGKQIITLGLFLGTIVLVISAVQQLVISLYFYDFRLADILGWFGIGLALLVRLSIKESKDQS